jgi:hypothetical protein
MLQTQTRMPFSYKERFFVKLITLNLTGPKDFFDEALK